MLSYGYTLLCHEAIGALEAAGLDPMVGFLHRHRWGRPALALDLMEEFRPTTGDVAVWRCISVRQVRPEQFTIEDPTSPTSRTGGSEPTMIVIVAYDITDDGRREDVAQLLSGYGPRVQLSVFECEVTSIDELRSLRAQLRERIDPLEEPGAGVSHHDADVRRALHHRCPHRRGTERLLDRPLISADRHCHTEVGRLPTGPAASRWPRGDVGTSDTQRPPRRGR